MDPGSASRLRTGWLGKTSQTVAEAILNVGVMRSFDDDEVIYGLGQDQASLWGVASGLVRMTITMNEQPPKFGHVVGPGFWFGETEFVTDRPGIIEMVASGNTTLLMVTRQAFRRVADAHPDAWPCVALLAVLNEGLAIGAADDLMIRDSRRRLAAVLLRLANLRNCFQGTPPLLHVPVSQPELAEAACLSRTVATDILREFSRKGWIETAYRTIRILRPEELLALLSK